jgi:hypothetical protein
MRAVFVMVGDVLGKQPLQVPPVDSNHMVEQLAAAAPNPTLGILTVADSAINSPQTVSLTGSGVVPVTVSPTSLGTAFTSRGRWLCRFGRGFRKPLAPRRGAGCQFNRRCREVCWGGQLRSVGPPAAANPLLAQSTNRLRPRLFRNP